VNKSFVKEAHYMAVANTDKLYSNAIEKPFPIDSRKKNAGVTDRKVLFSPMEYRGRIVPVKFTVLKYTNRDQNLYSIEAIDVDLGKKIEGAGITGLSGFENSKPLEPPLDTPSDLNIAHLFDSVNAFLSCYESEETRLERGRQRYSRRLA
jgi:hypothetical protein